jgi:hypothetical protein
VAFVSFTAHNFTAAGRSKALCGCFASFEFWHGLVLFGHKVLPYHVFATFCNVDLGVGSWRERVRWGDLGVGSWGEGPMGREFDNFFYLIPVSKKNATVGPYSKAC